MRRWWREVFLWAGAVAGLLALAAAVLVIGFGYTFLVFRSGSMGPQIPTGSLALAHTVPAADIAVGDVVSTETVRGTRVTHRVVERQGSGAEAQLTLQGDANNVPDEEVYSVTSAERVVYSVPGLGYVFAWLLTPAALLPLGAISAVLVMSGFKRDREDDEDDDHPEGGARRDRSGGARAAKRAAAVGTASFAVLVGTAAPTMAYFSDVANMKTGNITARAAPAAAPRTPSCTQNSDTPQSVRIAWTAPTSGATGWYRVQVTNSANTVTYVSRAVNALNTTFLYTDFSPGPADGATVTVRIATLTGPEGNWVSSAVTDTITVDRYLSTSRYDLQC